MPNAHLSVRKGVCARVFETGIEVISQEGRPVIMQSSSILYMKGRGSDSLGHIYLVLMHSGALIYCLGNCE